MQEQWLRSEQLATVTRSHGLFSASLKEKLDKKIYKNILTKYFNKLDSKTHLSIWKILLKFSDIKKKYDYNQILEEVNKSPESVKNIDIIKLDIIRTSFETEEESKRIKIGNMLKAISKELPSLNYCQGMNQIAAFLLDVPSAISTHTY